MTFPRVVLLIIFFCGMCVSYQKIQIEKQPYSFPDETIAVTVTPSETSLSAPTVKSCFRSSSNRIHNVRFQEIESKAAVFERVSVIVEPMEMVSDRDNVTALSIKECADKTSEAGFAAFHFNGSLCRMFTPKDQICRSDVGGWDVIYVQDFFWDKKDRVFPKIISTSYGLVGRSRYNSAIFPRLLSREADLVFDVVDPLVNETPLQDISKTVYKLVEVVGSVYQVPNIIGENCARVDCDVPSNYSVYDSLPTETESNVFPPTYMLSECGNTITFPGDKDGGYYSVVMSHNDFGCDWYPKPSEDHACVVTIDTLPTNVSLSLLNQAMFVDGGAGETSGEACLGDSVQLYLGNTPDSGTPLYTFDSCDPGVLIGILTGIETTPITLVFNRKATQSQPKNVANLGFSFLLWIET